MLTLSNAAPSGKQTLLAAHCDSRGLNVDTVRAGIRQRRRLDRLKLRALAGLPPRPARALPTAAPAPQLPVGAIKVALRDELPRAARSHAVIEIVRDVARRLILDELPELLDVMGVTRG